MPAPENPVPDKLYYGDNLAVLRDYIPSQSVDLIYLDPPFNSRQDYNVLFAERDGARSASQITAFKDTWEWNEEAARSYEQVVEAGGRVAEAMRAFRTLLGGSDMLAYLAMMAPRLVELRRVLKESGSIYLHCAPPPATPRESAASIAPHNSPANRKGTRSRVPNWIGPDFSRAIKEPGRRPAPLCRRPE
jgi:DNA modification methylase